jgi:hypothetical protein
MTSLSRRLYVPCEVVQLVDLEKGKAHDGSNRSFGACLQAGLAILRLAFRGCSRHETDPRAALEATSQDVQLCFPYEDDLWAVSAT